MFRHPIELAQLAEQREQDLYATARASARPVGTAPAGLARRLRRSLGLRLIAVGQRLAGPLPAGAPARRVALESR